jgi:F-type H+-transporting ATPase subunit beta
VAEKFTSYEGRYVPVTETIKGFAEILDGLHDGVPENLFLNAGGIEDVVKKSKAGG